VKELQFVVETQIPVELRAKLFSSLIHVASKQPVSVKWDQYSVVSESEFSQFSEVLKANLLSSLLIGSNSSPSDSSPSDPSHFRLFCASLSYCYNLQCLDFSQYNMATDDWNLLFRSVQATNIETLKLGDGDVQGFSVASLTSSVGKSHVADLSFVIGARAAQDLIELATALPNIQRLNRLCLHTYGCVKLLERQENQIHFSSFLSSLAASSIRWLYLSDPCLDENQRNLLKSANITLLDNGSHFRRNSVCFFYAKL
jgi:hypothetical protein